MEFTKIHVTGLVGKTIPAMRLSQSMNPIAAADEKFKKALDFMRILADRHEENFDPDSREKQ